MGQTAIQMILGDEDEEEVEWKDLFKW